MRNGALRQNRRGPFQRRRFEQPVGQRRTQAVHGSYWRRKYREGTIAIFLYTFRIWRGGDSCITGYIGRIEVPQRTVGSVGTQRSRRSCSCKPVRRPIQRYIIRPSKGQRSGPARLWELSDWAVRLTFVSCASANHAFGLQLCDVDAVQQTTTYVKCLECMVLSYHSLLGFIVASALNGNIPGPWPRGSLLCACVVVVCCMLT